MPTKEKVTFEESMTRLEEIVGLLERGDAPLEKAMSLFEEGAAILADYENFCAKLREQGDELFDRCFERWLK